MSQFHSLKIIDIQKITNDCSLLTFEVPDNLKKKFGFKSGQFLNLKAKINGNEIRRSYSICSSSFENKWQVAIKKINGGIFSTFVNENLKKGDFINCMTPTGNFTVDIDISKPKNYIFFAAGSGITPILSMIKTLLNLNTNCCVKLFYLNKTIKSIIFKEEIEQLKNKYFDRLEIFHFLSKEFRNIDLLNGRFTKEKLQILTTYIIDIDITDECYICGPKEMIFLIKNHLTSKGLNEDKIHFELFFSGNFDTINTQINTEYISKIDGTDVTIIEGGKEFHFLMNNDFDNILDSALAVGIDLPFACKGGVCSTCRCKIISGTLQMKVNYALEEIEIAKGMILSCQAIPISKKVVLEFG